MAEAGTNETLKLKCEMFRLEARKEFYTNKIKENRQTHSQSVTPFLASPVGDAHSYIENLLRKELKENLLLLYYSLSNIRMHLNSQDEGNLSLALDNLFASGKARNLLCLLVRLTSESPELAQKEQLVDIRLLCISELLWVCVSLFCAKEEDLQTHLNSEVLNALVRLLDTLNIVIVDRIFFALANAAEENFALVNQFESAQVFAHADEAIERLHQVNPRGQPFTLGNYFALVRALVGIGATPPRTLDDYLQTCLKCYASRYEHLAVTEPIVLRLVADLSCRTSVTALSFVWSMPEFANVISRINSALQGVPANCAAGLTALAALSSGITFDKSIPGDLLEAVFQKGLCSIDPKLQMNAMVVYGNALSHFTSVDKHLVSSVLFRAVELVRDDQSSLKEIGLQVITVIARRKELRADSGRVVGFLDECLHKAGNEEVRRLALGALDAWLP